ncbi:MAG: hypothetical protein V4649_18120 [Bacteroidota bacterium]
MKKLFIAALLLLASGSTHAYNYYYNIKPYHLALTLSNPLSASFKYGGGWEHRYRNFAYMLTYYKYTGAYPGTQMNMDMRIYLRKRWMNERTNVHYQHFIYTRGIFGTAGFDGPKLAIFGYDSKVELAQTLYYGVAAGVGRRYSKGHFFVTLKGGLKYCEVADVTTAEKKLYRLFYATGPGSILEFNIQFGLQL